MCESLDAGCEKPPPLTEPMEVWFDLPLIGGLMYQKQAPSAHPPTPQAS